MSYCVNCGVKLKVSETSCPLCGTPVINPNCPSDLEAPVYPDKIENIRRINVKNLSLLIVDILLVLAAICILCDLLTSHSLSWSFYVFFSAMYLGCQVTFIVKKDLLSSLLIEFFATAVFVLAIALLCDGLHWYLIFALPMVAIVCAYLTVCALLIRRKKRNNLRTASICLFLCSAILIWVDAGTHLCTKGAIELSWAMYAVLPVSVVGIIAYLLSFSKKLVDEIKQRIFI